MLDIEKVEDFSNGVIDYVADCIRMEVERRNGRKDYRSALCGALHEPKVFKMERRFPNAENEPAALLESDVGRSVKECPALAGGHSR